MTKYSSDLTNQVVPESNESLPENEAEDETQASHPNRSPPPVPPMIVMSNRLPFVLKRKSNCLLERKASAGGLVTAVAPVVISCGGVWVGWTGLHDFDPDVDVIPESDPLDRAPTAGLRSKQTMPVAIERTLFNLYYNGCCNETYWPLFHSMPDRAIFNTDYWNAYVKVNDIFALRTMESIRKMTEERASKDGGGDNSHPESPPIIWIHDYHLMLTANAIRNTCAEEKIKIRMGFFLHIPFPSFDIIRIFPWVDEILMGMLGCDLVGFHIEDYCLNFIDCCQRLLGCRIDRKKMIVHYQNRCVHVKALPIGIPYQRFEALSRTADRVFAVGLKVILGVDRLDYTKGLVARLKALDMMFECYPHWKGRVTFLQVAVPSRTDVQEYRDLKESIDKQVGAINGKYSTPSWSPIRYIFGCVSQDELVAFYRDADVALVTPLRDGMNLVAKEFVASQNDEDPGVLILSPFAGAGGLMHEALMANPYEVLNVATSLDRALAMHLDERKLRMNQLKRREKRMDVDAWVRGFLSGMQSLDGGFQPMSQGQNSEFQEGEFDATLADDIETYTKLGIIVDFDGTLSYLARTPELAIISPETRRVLERLSNMPDVNVVIISGRELEDLRRKVGVEGISYAASHGLNIRHPDGHIYNHKIPEDYKLSLQELADELRERVEAFGAWVECKDLLVAWHFREVEKDMKDELYCLANDIYASYGFKTLEVSKRLENIPPEGWNRGDSCIHILRSLYGVDWEERVKVIYAGDSAADEMAIQRLKGVACTFRVINEDSMVITKTAADYRLGGPGGVLNLLKFLEKKLVGKTPKTISRASSVLSIDRELIEMSLDSDQPPSPDVKPFRLRTGSQETSKGGGFRRRTNSQGNSSGDNLRKKTLSNSLHHRLSRDESNLSP